MSWRNLLPGLPGSIPHGGAVAGRARALGVEPHAIIDFSSNIVTRPVQSITLTVDTTLPAHDPTGTERWLAERFAVAWWRARFL